MQEFEGKVSIVTGATSGMGKDIATRLVSLKGNVVLSGRDTDRGSSLEEELGAQALFVSGDVGDPLINQTLVHTARDKFGRLDYVVMSAGKLGIGSITELSVEEWNKTIHTNLSSIFYLLKHAIPVMLESGGGSIVVIGSVAAHHAFPNHPAYTASKGALPSLVRQIALDYGPEIRINLVSPAQVRTPLLYDSVKAFPNPDEILQDTAQKLPMKRLGEPGDITGTVIHLLSNQASWITGADFVVDGGFLVG